MDDWGVDGCRQHRDVIIKWMKEAAFSRWFNEQVRIGWALAHEQWFNPLDPFGSIVDEAIRRAAEASGGAAAYRPPGSPPATPQETATSARDNGHPRT